VLVKEGFMKKGLIWIIVGIGIMAYNYMSADGMLVLRGTNIDYGYIAIGIGVIIMVSSKFRKGEEGAS
jgi:hypothetical protein